MSFKVDVDVSDIVAARKNAERVSRRLGRSLIIAAKRAADDLKSGDRYQDRTGDLRKNTEVLTPRDSDNETEVVLQMNEDYASFVIGRGFSDFDDKKAELEDTLELVCDNAADQMAKP